MNTLTEALGYLLASLSGTATSILVVGYLSRRALELWLKRAESEAMSRLDARAREQSHELHVAAERARHELAREAFEHQTRYARVHELALGAMTETYRKLVRSHRAVANMVKPLVTSGDAPESERIAAAVTELNALFSYFSENAIYLHPETCGKLEALFRDLKSVVIDFQYKDHTPSGVDRDPWIRAINKFEQDVGPAKASLEADFRNALGISSTAHSG